MSNFDDDLRGKAYQLVNGVIDLEEFSSWFKLSIVTAGPTQSKPFVPPPRPERFKDYERDIDAPDQDMREHHRKLLGDGEQE